MIKIIAYYPKIRFIKDAPNIEFKAQEKSEFTLRHKYEKEHPDEFVWGVVRNAGTTIYAQLRSELKPISDMDYFRYCKRKGIMHPDIEDRELHYRGNGSYYYGKRKFDSRE